MCCPFIWFVQPKPFALFNRGDQPSEGSGIEAGLWPFLCPVAAWRGYQGRPVFREGFIVRPPVVDSCPEGSEVVRMIRVSPLGSRREFWYREARTDRVLSGEIWSRKTGAESGGVSVAFQVWRYQHWSQGHIAEQLGTVVVSFVVVDVVGIREPFAG